MMHFHYMTNMVMPFHKTPVPGVIKFTILVDPSFVIITIYFINTTILHFFIPNYLPLEWGGHEIYNFLSSYPIDATYQIRIRLAQ